MRLFSDLKTTTCSNGNSMVITGVVNSYKNPKLYIVPLVHNILTICAKVLV